jgi:hypothetical protein
MIASPFGALAVIVDPAAGGGRVGSQVTAVQQALETRRIEHRLHVATGRQDVARSAGLALEEGYRFLAAVGDDATVHDVVNGMFRDGRTIVETPVLAVLGAGRAATCGFGLPDDVDEAAAPRGRGDVPLRRDEVAASARDRTISLRAQRGGGGGCGGDGLRGASRAASATPAGSWGSGPPTCGPGPRTCA